MQRLNITTSYVSSLDEISRPPGKAFATILHKQKICHGPRKTPIPIRERMYPGKPVVKPRSHLVYGITFMNNLVCNISAQLRELLSELSGFYTDILCRRTEYPRPLPGVFE